MLATGNWEERVPKSRMRAARKRALEQSSKQQRYCEDADNEEASTSSYLRPTMSYGKPPFLVTPVVWEASLK